MSLHAIGKNLLVRRKESATVSEGGILIPDAAVKKHNEGTVESVGNEVVCVTDGVTVLFNAYSGVELEDGLLVMKEDDILAVRMANVAIGK